jgi:hypothetical protein
MQFEMAPATFMALANRPLPNIAASPDPASQIPISLSLIELGSISNLLEAHRHTTL